MPRPPEPAALYPDVAAAGSLAAALRAVADGALDDVPLTSPDDEPLLAASTGSVPPRREPLRVTASPYARTWSVGADDRILGLPVLRGATDDLAQIARAVRAWHDGASPDDVHAAAPFARPTGRFELAEPDPGLLVESEWSQLRTEAAELNTLWAFAHRDLVEAAHAAPEFRALYPFTSHWALRFSSATRPLLDVVGPVLWCTGEGGFKVARVMSEDAREFRTAEEAVAAALMLLPDGIGPVRYGEMPQPG
ncbi:DUF6193 family natural product biosynthesis protein [Streptomyces hydrogenans]|uniref:DUF6193 family natural product biosynthesis protein n=1 Tax=Streptomyces hydrogenans TaxID=1873719 RepID=UPI0037F73A0C